MLVDGVAHLDEERAVFEAMLTGWERQQRSRMLGDATVRARDRLVRRFTEFAESYPCLLYTSPSPRDKRQSRMPSSA